jgi:hypothetical protein
MLRSVSSLRIEIGECGLLLVGSIDTRVERDREVVIRGTCLGARWPNLPTTGRQRVVYKQPGISGRITATSQVEVEGPSTFASCKRPGLWSHGCECLYRSLVQSSKTFPTPFLTTQTSPHQLPLPSPSPWYLCLPLPPHARACTASLPSLLSWHPPRVQCTVCPRADSSRVRYLWLAW